MELKLRRVVQSDLTDEFVKWYDNKDGHLNYFSGSQKSFSKRDLQDWVSDSNPAKTHFFLVSTDEGEPIGTVKIGPIDFKNRTSDLVCLIGNRSYLGKGLASKAIGEANQIAFNELDIRRLHSGMYRDNIASIKAYQRAGWFIEAEMKGFYLVGGKAVDRVCVACLNPKYFGDDVNNEN